VWVKKLALMTRSFWQSWQLLWSACGFAGVDLATRAEHGVRAAAILTDVFDDWAVEVGDHVAHL
jgi:hypothetical protein